LWRGLQLVVLGYCLRLQMWMIDAGGYRRLGHWVAASGLLTAYVLAHRALRPRVKFDWRPWAASVALCTASLTYLQQTDPTRLIGLLRVDVLQGIGLSTVVVCAVCLTRPALVTKPIVLATLGLVIAFAAGWVRHWVPGPLPVPIVGYVAAWQLPPGARSTTLFPLFPWMSYVFVGAASAIAWSRRHALNGGRRSLVYVAIGGAAAAFSVAESQPWVRAVLGAVSESTDLARVVYRLAIIGTLTVPAMLIARTAVGKSLQQLGTASLLIYWVHLEFAFGVLAHPLSHKLNVGGWLVGFVILTAAMTALAFAINAQVGVRRLQTLAVALTRWRRT
jgi:hypothetical protein